MSRKIPILVDPNTRIFLYQGATLVKPNINELRHAIGIKQRTGMIKKKKSAREILLVCSACYQTDGMTLVEQTTQTFPQEPDVYFWCVILLFQFWVLHFIWFYKRLGGLINIVAGIVVEILVLPAFLDLKSAKRSPNRKKSESGRDVCRTACFAVRDSRQRRAYCFYQWVFRAIHAGHVSYLEEAKKKVTS